MKDRDVLDDAFDALREETRSADGDRAAATRRALLLTATTTRRRRALTIRYVVPLAAALAAGTAWAAATGRLAPLLSSSPEPTAPTAVPTATATATPTATAATAATPTAVPTTTAIAVPTTASVNPAPSASPSTAERGASPPPEETLYRAAHEAHFVAKDPARALTSWDVYLAAHPNGRFAPDARYNRALTLIRLGRTSEARAALRPFADATPGSYRQAEAKSLLDALE